MKVEITEEKTIELLNGIKIPLQPTILIEFVQERNNPNMSLRKIADSLSKDVAISAGILKTVNSPFFGLRQKIASIPQAVSLLGINNVSNLVFSLSLKNAFKKNQSPFLKSFWDRTNEIALLSARICRNYSVQAPDEAYTLGLMSDCGVPVIAERFEHYDNFYMSFDHNGESTITEAENELFSTDHTVVGAFLAKRWQFPQLIRLGIEHHHRPIESIDLDDKELQTHLSLLLAIRCLAEVISNRYHQYDRKQSVGLSICPEIQSALHVSEVDLEEIEDECHTLLNESDSVN